MEAKELGGATAVPEYTGEGGSSAEFIVGGSCAAALAAVAAALARICCFFSGVTGIHMHSAGRPVTDPLGQHVRAADEQVPRANVLIY